MSAPGLQPAALSQRDARLQDAVRGVLVIVATLLSVATLVGLAAQESGLRFGTYALVLALVALAALATVGRSELRGSLAVLRSRPGPSLALALLAVAAASLVLLCQQQRLDDLFYIPNVLYYVAHPDALMGHRVHFVDGGETEILSFYVGTAMPFEYAQGAIAHLLGLHVLSVYHVLAPAAFGSLLPLVWYYTLSRFEFDDRAAIVGAALICLCLLLMGEAHRTFGNYAFNRLWHGKAVVMALGVPLFTGLSIDFFRRPQLRRWLYLFASATALVGLSTSSIVLLALLAPALALASIAAFPGDLRTIASRVASYAATLAVVGAFALMLWVRMASDLGAEDSVNEAFARDFWGQARYVFSSGLSTTGALCLVSGGAALLVLRGWQRRFFAAWLAFVAVAYLNPFVAPYVIDYVTSTNLYWRLFYLLPFPLAIGVLGAGVAGRLGVGVSRPGNAIAAAAAALLLAVHALPGSSSIFQHQTRVGLGYKIDARDRRLAEGVIAASPQGSMLAPWHLGAVVTLLNGTRPQLTTRQPALDLWFGAQGRSRQAAMRRSASDFLDGQQGQGLEVVLKLVRQHPRLRSVVAQRRVARAADLELVLAAEGFRKSSAVGPFEVFAR